MGHRLLIMLDYPRMEYVDKATNDFEYSISQEGKNFVKVLKQDLGLQEGKDYKFVFLYDKLPKVGKSNKWGKILSYKNPTAKELNPYKELMDNYLAEYKPDLIIPQGTLSTKYLINKPITKCQGSVTKVQKDDDTFYVLPLFRQGYVEIQPNLLAQRDIGLSILKEYVDKGEVAFKSTKVDFYSEPHTVEDFKHLVARCKTTGELAWDTEDNTLNPDRKGAKVLIFSFAWAEGKSASLPLEHWEVYQPSGKTILGKPNLWTDEQLAELYQIIDTVMQAKTLGDIPFSSDMPDKELPPETPLVKVGHNIIFDIKFLMSTKHITWAENISDTKIGYWLEVSQDDKTDKTLSDLAFGLTSMGGYDAPLEDYKNFIKQQVFISAENVLKAKIAEAKLKANDTTIQLDESDYNAIKDDIDWSIAKNLNFYYDGLEDWCINILAIPKLNKHRLARKVTNEIDPKGSGNDFNYEWIPLEIQSYYASGDSDCCLRLHHRLVSMMKNDQKDPNNRLLYLYEDYYPKVTVGFACLESWGMRADTKYMDKIAVKYTEEKNRLIEEMRKYPVVQGVEQYKQAQYEDGLMEWQKPPKERDEKKAAKRNKYKGKIAFNPRSAEDSSNLLFVQMGYVLPYSKDYIKKKAWDSKKGEDNITVDDYSTGKKALEYLSRKSKEDNDGNYGLLDLLEQYSKVAQLQSSFTTKLRNLVSNKDGNVHGGYNITGTTTSRSSSNHPNLQQLPSHTNDVDRYDYKYPIKREFVSRYKDGKLFNIDYSNLEFRILGLVTNENSMTEAFLTGHDIHKSNASLAFNVPYEEVTKAQRQAAKSIGFGIVYGRGANSVAEATGETLDQANKMIEKFYASKPRVKKFIEDTHQQVVERGYVNTIIGFRRDLQDIWSTDRTKQASAERESVNTIIQGSGASLTNYAVYLITKLIHDKNLKTRVFVTVHDSIGLDCPPEEVPVVPEACLYIMTHLPFKWLYTTYKGERIRYPVDADMEIGNNYNDMVEFNKEDYLTFNNKDNYIKYYRTLDYISDLKESDKISEVEFDAMTKHIESKKSQYQA